MEKYKETKEMDYNKMIRIAKKREGKIELNLSMKEAMERKAYEYSKNDVEIKYEYKVEEKSSMIV